MNTNELELNRHEQALSLHQQVMTSGSLAAQNLFDMATALKEMRDGKLYKELGYQNFESYCEKMVGMKHSNAYRYISIAENIKPESFPTLGNFGASKLMLLARLSDEEQKEIAEKIDETTTYKQLQEEINRIKGEKLKLENEREKLNAKLKAEAANVEEARSDLERAEKELKIAQIKSAAEMDRANRTAVKLQDQQRENVRLEKENRELRSRPVEVAVVDNSDSERRLQEIIRSLERENIRQNELMDQRYAEDRRELEEQKQREIDAIRAEYEQKLKDAAAEAQPEDKDKQEFKVFLVMAHDALTRLVAVANTHRSEPVYANKVKELLSSANKMLEE